MKTSPVSIVTAASQGIGAACARRLRGNGFEVVIMSRSPKVHDLAGELDCLGVTGSVTNIDDLTNLVEQTIERHGRVDAVISGTGHPPKGNLLGITDDEWHAALDMLLLNVIRMSRLATPHMVRSGGGAFVNISSFAARAPSLAYPASSVIRAALSNFALLFGREYAAKNIRMNNVLPGFVDSYPVPEETVSRISAGRPSTTDEIADVVAFLASGRASYLTGQDIVVDGGLIAGR